MVDLVTIGFTRELGSLLTAIAGSGRSGSAFSAEIGSMVVTEELDALRTMAITTNNPIQIQGKVLAPGRYVMRLLDSPSDRNIVQIFDADETKLEMTVLANSAFRPEPTGDTRFTFYETANGQVQALRTWFYPGDNYGIEFSAIR